MLQPKALIKANNFMYEFNKAFNKVPHKRLCLQLKWHGINVMSFDWIVNLLSGCQRPVLGTKW